LTSANLYGRIARPKFKKISQTARLVQPTFVQSLVPLCKTKSLLEIGVRGPIPVPAGQLFATISRSIHFALQKHKLPKAGFCQISFRGFHFGFLLSAKDGQVSPINPDQPFHRKGLLSNPSRQC
jgi:hypothetical protein